VYIRDVCLPNLVSIPETHGTCYDIETVMDRVTRKYVPRNQEGILETQVARISSQNYLFLDLRFSRR
jgi:hypothetical protein